MKKSPLSIAVYDNFVNNSLNSFIINHHKKSFDHAINCGLGPIILHCLRDQEDIKSSENYPALLSSDLTSQILIGEHINALIEILQYDPSFTEKIILLKGISTCMRYPKPHMRIMGDIDLLVDENSEARLEEICFVLGYIQNSTTPASFFEQHHHSMPFYHPDKKIWIEIHACLFPPKSIISDEFTFSKTNIFNQTTEINFSGITTRALNNELLLVHTCTHWALELNWMKSQIQILDILLLINNSPDLNWKKILTWADNSIIASHLFIILSIFKKYKLISISDNIIMTLEKKSRYLNKPIIYILQTIIIHYIFSGRPFSNVLSQSNISIVWTSLLMKKQSPILKILFLPFYIMFPPDHNKRFNMIFQLCRIKSIFRRN